MHQRPAGNRSYWRLGFTRALKNNIPTPKYAFSSDGKIIALLLQRLDLAKKQDADEKIFQLFKSAYNFRNDSAANRLQVKLLERLKLDGLLGELLDMVTDYLSNLHELMRILDVLGIMIIAAFHNPRTTRKVWSSYVATFNDIDRKTCRILFRCEKMRLENNIASGSRLRTKEWEDLLIDNVTDDSKIVLAGACKNCLKASPIVVDYLKYLKGILISDERMYATTCPKCKSQRTFYILPGKDSKELQKLQMPRFL